MIYLRPTFLVVFITALLLAIGLLVKYQDQPEEIIQEWVVTNKNTKALYYLILTKKGNSEKLIIDVPKGDRIFSTRRQSIITRDSFFMTEEGPPYTNEADGAKIFKRGKDETLTFYLDAYREDTIHQASLFR